MGEQQTRAHLIAAFYCQTKLYELEVAFLTNQKPHQDIRKELDNIWPHAFLSFQWCAASAPNDVRAALMCGKLAGVAGHLLQETKGRLVLIEWREAAVAGAMRALERGNLPNSADYDMVHDLLGHLTYLGYLHFANNNLSRARALLEQALEVGRTHDRHFADSAALVHLAFVAITEQKLDEAERLLLQALTSDGEGGQESGSSQARVALGVVYERRGEHAKAREQYDLAIADYEATSNLPGLCTALINRAGVLLDLGDPSRAREDSDRAETIVTSLNSPGLFGLLKANRARLDAHEHPEANSEALELLETSKADFDRAGDRVQSSRIGGMLEDLYRSGLEREHNAWSYAQRRLALQKLANLAAERGGLAEAAEIAERAAREARIAGEQEDRIASRRHAAHWLVLKDDHERAKRELDEALVELDEVRATMAADVVDEIRRDLLSLLGQCQRRLGIPVVSAASFRAALEIAKRTGEDALVTQLKGNLALALVDQGQFEEALPLLREAVDEHRGGEDYAQLGRARFNLAYGLYHAGDLEAALAEAAAAKGLLVMIADPKADETDRQTAAWGRSGEGAAQAPSSR